MPADFVGVTLRGSHSLAPALLGIEVGSQPVSNPAVTRGAVVTGLEQMWNDPVPHRCDTDRPGAHQVSRLPPRLRRVALKAEQVEPQ